MANAFLNASSSMTVEESLSSSGLSLSSDLRAASRSAVDHLPITPVHCGNSIAPNPHSVAASDRNRESQESRGEKGMAKLPEPDQLARYDCSHLSAFMATIVRVIDLAFLLIALRRSDLKWPTAKRRHGAARARKLSVPVIFSTRFTEMVLVRAASAAHLDDWLLKCSRLSAGQVKTIAVVSQSQPRALNFGPCCCSWTATPRSTSVSSSCLALCVKVGSAFGATRNQLSTKFFACEDAVLTPM